TGGIGSGKSTVAALLEQHGATLIDTDAIARELTQPAGAAIAPIRAAFGDEVIDDAGGLHRERMRAIAFADPQARRRLEAILHPLIGIETDRRSAQSPSPVKVFDVPLLVESGRWRGRVDRVLVVDCSEATQVARVAQRAGWTTEAARTVVAQQASREARRACADAVIHNDGITQDELSAQVRDLWERWCGGS
ncbi:MAG TPA: dephospho-CoA kinase, partial [Albitalea sp.]|nr:dephospho-CoA kinase [Albitalea sp.]